MRLGRGLSEEEVERFAREDGRIARHLDVVKRKELLEGVLKNMQRFKTLEGREGRREEAKRGKERDKGWRLF